jgi:hypothetical protein
VASYIERGNETSDSIEGEEIIHHVSDYQFLKRDTFL